MTSTSTPQSQKDLPSFSFSFVPTDMSAARTEWNTYANNTLGHGERSSDKDKQPSRTPPTSSSRVGTTSTGVDKEHEPSSVKNAPQGAVTREATSTTDTITRRAESNEVTTTHPEAVTRTVIGPPEFFYPKVHPFYFSETR